MLHNEKPGCFFIDVMLKTIFVLDSISRSDGCDCFYTDVSMDVAVTCIPRHLSTLFWYHCIMLILLFFIHPHSWTPYVHTGHSTCLYKSSLLYSDSSDWHLSSQYIFQNLICSSPCFFLMCVIPRYFAVLARGILTPLRRIDRWSIFSLVKLSM
jgi:hypothetical protein